MLSFNSNVNTLSSTGQYQKGTPIDHALGWNSIEDLMDNINLSDGNDIDTDNDGIKNGDNDLVVLTKERTINFLSSALESFGSTLSKEAITKIVNANDDTSKYGYNAITQTDFVKIVNHLEAHIGEDVFATIGNSKNGSENNVKKLSSSRVQNNQNYVKDASPEAITGSIKQFQVGNCAFLVTMGALNDTPEGRKLIDDCVEKNDDGSYPITFPAYPDKTYIITAEEVKNGKSFLRTKADGTPQMVAQADSDPLVTVLYLGVERLMADEGRGKAGLTDILIESVFDKQSTRYFLGDNVDDVQRQENINTLREYLKSNPDDLSLTIAGGVGEKGAIFTGYRRGIHAFYAESYDAKTDMITYKNPHNSEKTYTISVDDVAKYSSDFTIFDPS
jgi:hypothetical protein